MPSYVYKAKKDSAETVMGQINAQNEDEAIELINQLGLLPVSVEESTAQGMPVRAITRRSVAQKEVFMFTRQLHSLVKSGLPILKALDMLGRQTPNHFFAKCIQEISANVKNGRSLSSSLSDYPAIFPALYVAMVHAGEESGNLKEMLSNLNDYQRRQQELAAKIRGALVYPAFMLCVGVGTVGFILTFVMPRVTKLFSDVKQALPWPTVVVMKISEILRAGGLWGVIAIAIGIFLVYRFCRTPAGRVWLSHISLRLPFVRGFVIRTDLARFTRTLQLLLKSGLPILQAIEIAAPTVHNQVLRREIMNSAEGLTGGSSLGDSLQNSSLIPDLMGQLIKIGEEAGSLSQSLGDIADNYEQEINDTTRTMTTLIEPVLILTIGLIVGFIVFAMLLPIFQMDVFAR